MLDRATILSKTPPRTVVHVPEWGGDVLVQGLSVRAAHALQSSTAEGLEAMAEIVIASVVNEDGSSVFSAEDKESLMDLGLAGLKRVSEAAAELNGMKPGAVEALAENFEATPTGDSSSGSRSRSGGRSKSSRTV